VIVCIGDLMLDILVATRSARDGMAEGILLRPGGSAANVAAWARRCGARSAWMGIVGDDPAGRMLEQSLRDQDVEVSATRIPDLESGVVISWIGRSGHRVMHSARWAGSRLAPEHIDLQLVRRASCLHLTGYPLALPAGWEAAAIAMREAHRAGALISFDPSSTDVIRAIEAGRLEEMLRDCSVDILFANRQEARALTGISKPRDAVTVLNGLFPLVVLKDGARGAYTGTREGVAFTPARRVTASDTTGAGDAFAGAWLAAYLGARDPVSASATASEAAAEAVTGFGGRPG